MPKFRQRKNWKDLERYCPKCKKSYQWNKKKCDKCGKKLMARLSAN